MWGGEGGHPCYGLLSIFQLSLFVWPNSPSRSSNPAPPAHCHIAPSASRLSLSLSFSLFSLFIFNLAAAKTSELRIGDARMS